MSDHSSFNSQSTPLYGTLVQAHDDHDPRSLPGEPDRSNMLLSLAPWSLAIGAVLLTVLLSSCSHVAMKNERRQILPEVNDALSEPSTGKAKALPPSVAQALLPPANLALPTLANRSPEPRFDLNVVGLPVAQVFAALARDTRYSMLVDPELKGSVTVNLKDVTLLEALDTLRDIYGFEYRIQGTRIFVQPATLQTRVFQINYLTASRSGRSDVRVTSGSISQSGSNSTGNTGNASTSTSSSTSSQESSRIVTQSRNDLWAELETSLRLLLGGNEKSAGEGRQLIVSPQSSVIVVRALPRELRAVEDYLKAARLNIERQVMLEAKIVDVRLKDGAQAGINWATFLGGGNGQNHAGSTGFVNPGSTLANTGNLTNNVLSSAPGSTLALSGATANGVFGLAFQTSNFAALLQFLESQGDSQVLSSPRIAAVNNQKAVLKVGTDDFFVTNVSTNIQSGAAGGQPITTPTITVQPFFSGIALDVTPQIDDDGNVMLHVHPSVTDVQERAKIVNLGNLGNFTLPLASSSISETDTVVRVRDGNIVAIGGLMKTVASRDRSQLPGLGDVPVVGAAFSSSSKQTAKHELVILIKPTVIHSDGQLDAMREDSLQRLQSMTNAPNGNW